jgi:hypothetical protein
MTEAECLQKMIAPGQKRPWVSWRQGCIQILVTQMCDKACMGCTQGSNLAGPKWFMTPGQFRLACKSLKGYFGVVGVFGGNPAISPHFIEYCRIMREEIPQPQRGLWCNNPITLANAKAMKETFNPAHSNLNVHMDHKAYALFKEGWPGSMPFGLDRDSRHSPPWVAMKDLDALPVFDKNHRLIAEMENTEENRLGLIADCDINQKWSASIGVFRGELRAWFCEIAMAQSIRHQDDPDYPDTGVKIVDTGDGNVACGFRFVHNKPSEDGLGVKRTMWWEFNMESYGGQVRKHCHECSVPLRGHGELALSNHGEEQTSQTHASIFKPKKAGRAVELVTTLDQLRSGKIDKSTNYIANAGK